MKLGSLKKNNSLTVLMFFITFNSNAQEVKYKFSYSILNQEFEESFTKKVINDSVYKEKDIFETISKNITFLKDFKTKSIYIIDKKNRKLFFDGSTTDLILDYNERSINLNWKKTLLKTKDDYIVYKLKLNPIDIFITHQSIYYFTFECGVIAIEGNDFILRREGFEFW